MSDFRCEFCGEEFNTLYEGWFRTIAATQPHAVGTASAGLLQLRVSCIGCLVKLIDNGMAMAKSIPEGLGKSCCTKTENQ